MRATSHNLSRSTTFAKGPERQKRHPKPLPSKCQAQPRSLL